MIAPSTYLINQSLTNNFDSNTSITVGEAAILNLSYPYLGTPVPSWYSQVNAQLSAIQDHAKGWLDGLGPQLFAGAPQGVINIGNTVTSCANLMNAIVQEIEASPGAAITAEQQSNLLTLANAISDDCGKLQEQCQASDRSYRDFIQQFVSDRDTLVATVQQAEQQLDYDAQLLQQIDAQITALQVKIARLTQKVTQEDIKMGASLFGTVVSNLTFAITLGAGPVVSMCLGIVRIGLDMVKEIKNSQEIQQDIAAITRLMVQANDDTFQMISLKSMIHSINNILYENMDYQDALPSLGALIEITSLQAQTIAVALAQNQPDVSLIPNLNDLDETVGAWSDIVDFATKVETSSLTNASVTLPMNAPA